MKKRLLLFAAVLTASANFMFAENKTVQDSNGNTFSYDTKTDLDASSYTGETIYANTASFDILPAQYKITLKSDQRIQVSDCSLLYNVKLSALSATPGTIEQFTEHLHNDFIKYNVVVFENTISSEILDEDDDLIGYAKKEGEDYNRYIIACERAKVIDGSVIYKGSELLSGAYKGTIIREDLDEVAICSDLYYARTSKKGNFMPILNVDGDYASGVTYLGSTVTYVSIRPSTGNNTYIL
jgi:hypothetical protein